MQMKKMRRGVGGGGWGGYLQTVGARAIKEKWG